ncbi:hypothetical protein BC629DRAFT_1553351 [Irpex lacteus]|nr:hypothetical protein BC629DRAFT_1553351 [Irpex lacteus]
MTVLKQARRCLGSALRTRLSKHLSPQLLTTTISTQQPPLSRTMATNYTQPPPSYTGPKNNSGRDEAEQPLLSPAPGPSSGAYYDQPELGDIPDDFKYGTSVYDSAPEIRNAFVRKLATCIVAGGLSQSESAIFWVQTHHPLNLVLLSTFTLMEAFTLGVMAL